MKFYVTLRYDTEKPLILDTSYADDSETFAACDVPLIKAVLHHILNLRERGGYKHE